jgi:hypothetical protein
MTAKKRGGRREGAGRKPGVPNKVSGDLKGMILDALHREGGVTYLQNVAQTDSKAFCALLGRVLPSTLTSDPDNPVKLELVVRWGDTNASSGAKS